MVEIGKGLLLFGSVLMAIGALLLFGGKIPWLGRLPGDLTLQRDHFTFYFPLMSSLVVSLVLSLFMLLFRR